MEDKMSVHSTTYPVRSKADRIKKNKIVDMLYRNTINPSQTECTLSFILKPEKYARQDSMLKTYSSTQSSCTKDILTTVLKTALTCQNTRRFYRFSTRTLAIDKSKPLREIGEKPCVVYNMEYFKSFVCSLNRKCAKTFQCALEIIIFIAH